MTEVYRPSVQRAQPIAPFVEAYTTPGIYDDVTGCDEKAARRVGLFVAGGQILLDRFGHVRRSDRQIIIGDDSPDQRPHDGSDPLRRRQIHRLRSRQARSRSAGRTSDAREPGTLAPSGLAGDGTIAAALQLMPQRAEPFWASSQT
ncbi:hypothetical protein GCM10018955_18220 [Planomonospora venezuelensis]